MPKLIGNIQFTGSLDNFTAYTRRGTDGILLRRKGGASKKKIKTSPKFAATRQNNAEFGACSKAGTSIRRVIRVIRHMADVSLAGKLNALCRIILGSDSVNKRGQRSINFSQQRYLLDGYNLNSKLLFNSVIRQPVTPTIFRNTGSANLVLPPLLPGVNFYIPPQYQLYRFIMVLGEIPDMIYKSTGYQPAEPIRYQPAAIYTDWYAVKEKTTEQSFDLQLENFSGIAASNSLLLAIGIEFGYPMNNTTIQTVKYAGAAAIVAMG